MALTKQEQEKLRDKAIALMEWFKSERIPLAYAIPVMAVAMASAIKISARKMKEDPETVADRVCAMVRDVMEGMK